MLNHCLISNLNLSLKRSGQLCLNKGLKERRERPMHTSQSGIISPNLCDRIKVLLATYCASSKKLKTGDDEVTVEALSHGVPQEEEGATPSQNVSREEVAAPSHSQDIPNAPVGREAIMEEKVVHTSQSSIPIEEGYPEAEHKVCIKYASDTDSASDDDTPVSLYPVVDWELLPTGLGLINVFYRLDNSCNRGVMKFYQDRSLWELGLVLWEILSVGDIECLFNRNTNSDYKRLRFHDGTVGFSFLEVAAFGVPAVKILMLLQSLSSAIIRFLIYKVWHWFQDVAVQSSRVFQRTYLS
ncbi:hypothetical protein Tco_0598953 [Tanacetum coccineum]